MSKTDWAVLGLNALALMMAIAGFATGTDDLMALGLLVALPALIASSVHVLRNASGRAVAPEQPTRDSLDPHQFLDIDARLETLERAERQTLQALVDRGVVHGPASADAETEPGEETARVGASRPRANGQ